MSHVFLLAHIWETEFPLVSRLPSHDEEAAEATDGCVCLLIEPPPPKKSQDATGNGRDDLGLLLPLVGMAVSLHHSGHACHVCGLPAASHRQEVLLLREVPQGGQQGGGCAAQAL